METVHVFHYKPYHVGDPASAAPAFLATTRGISLRTGIIGGPIDSKQLTEEGNAFIRAESARQEQIIASLMT